MASSRVALAALRSLQRLIKLRQALLLSLLVILTSRHFRLFDLIHHTFHLIYRVLKRLHFPFKLRHPHLDMGKQYR